MKESSRENKPIPQKTTTKLELDDDGSEGVGVDVEGGGIYRHDESDIEREFLVTTKPELEISIVPFNNNPYELQAY